ncbi:MAG TPA: YfhO family protein [Candidatus Polarisedimenticolia bacterium]|nr:YfhO family protein [Candidatus Polarisedimenticolia bacterium]
MTSTPGARRWIAPSCLVLGVLLFFHPLLLGKGLLYFRDISLNHYPTRLYVTPLLRSGHLPLWNPYISGGMPLAANPNNLIFHPITLLFFFLPVPVAFQASILLQYFLAGWGMLLWARETGLSEEAALAGGLIYSFSGGMASCGTFHNLLASWAWVPLALFALARHRRTGSRAALAGFASALAVQVLAGDPVAAGTTLFIGLLEGLFDSRVARVSPARRMGALGLGVLFAFGLALVQILPAREMLTVSGRAAGIPYPDASSWALQPARLLEWIIPSLYGNVTALKPSSYWGGLVFEKGYPFLLTVYFGAIPLLLALGSLARRRDRRVWVLWGATLLCVVAALGTNAHLYPFLYRYAPLVASLRYPSRFLFPTFLFLSCLAALGLDHLGSEIREKRATSGARMLLGGSILLAAITAIVGFSPDLLDRLIRDGLGIPGSVGAEVMGAIALSLKGRFLRCALLAAGLGILLGAARRKLLRPSLFLALVILAAAVDLISANFHVNPVVRPAFYQARPVVLDLVGTDALIHRTYPDQRPPGLAVWARTDSAEWGYYWDAMTLRVCTALPHRIPLAFYKSIDLLSPRNVNDLAQEMPTLGAGRVRRLADIASVGTLMSYRDLDDPGLTLLGTVGSRTNIPLRLYHNPEPLPRAYVVSAARPERGKPLADLTDPAFTPRNEIYLEGIQAAEGAPGPGGSARFLEDRPERLVLEASAGGPGWLVLTDNYYPGWVAFRDGERTPILRANHLFRAVAVPAGEHRVVFEYRPASLALGAIGSLLTFLIGGVWMFRGRPRSAVPPR